MAPPRDITVRPDELFAHARAVAQMQHPFDYLRAAVKATGPGGIDMAFGVLCSGFGAVVSVAENSAEDTISKLSTAVDGAVGQLTEAVETYVHSERMSVRELTALGTELPSDAPNKLIQSGTEWDWKNYNPLDGGTFTNMDHQNWLKGAGAAGDAWDLYLETQKTAERNYATMAGHVAAVGAGTAGVIGDPVAAIGAGLAGWAMEHFKPFKLILDGLAGNPDMVKGASRTWKEIAEELHRLAGHYDAAVRYGTGNWNGDAGESYRDKFASPILDALKSAAVHAKSVSVLVGTAGDMVNMVRSLARDIAAEAAGMLASAALSRLGYKPPLQELEYVRFTLKTLKGVVSFLVVAADEFASAVRLVLESYKTVSEMIPKLNGV